MNLFAPTKKQLRDEMKTLKELISRHGGYITLINAQDNVAFELDCLRFENDHSKNQDKRKRRYERYD